MANRLFKRPPFPTATNHHTHDPRLDPPRHLSRRVTIGVIVAFVTVLTLWLLGTPSGLSGKLTAVGYAICHQIIARSFLIGGDPMPLCARCTGIYLGVTTGWLLMQIAGRSRAAHMPGRGVAAVLSLAVVAMGIDGINSYLHLFPGGVGVYEPHNTLRVVTGIFAGFAIFSVIYPVFNAVIWAEPDDDQRPIDNLKELLGCFVILGFVVLLVLSDRPIFLTVLAVASVIGVVLMLTMIGTVLFVMAFKLENSFHTVGALAIPILAGLTLTFIEIGGIDALRLFVTGTWAGLPLGG